MTPFGVDLSSNNHPGGAAIDFPAAYADLKARGGGAQPFVIVKATQGTGYVNPYFAQDVAAARAAGFAVAAYLMDQGNCDPAAEEAAFRRVAGPLPQWDDLELPDGNTAYAQHCAALVAQNPAAGDYLNQSEEDAGFPAGAGIWEANYNGQPGVTNRPALIHQYDSTGRVAGIAGYVDLNVWLGTEAQFESMFAGTVHTAAAGSSTPAGPAGEEPVHIYQLNGALFVTNGIVFRYIKHPATVTELVAGGATERGQITDPDVLGVPADPEAAKMAALAWPAQ